MIEIRIIALTMAALVTQATTAQAGDAVLGSKVCATIKDVGDRLNCNTSLAESAAKAHEKPGAGGYRRISLYDLKADIAGMEGQKIAVDGVLTLISLQTANLGIHNMDPARVLLNTDSLPRDQRRVMFQHCADMCSAEVSGVVTNGPGGPGVAVERVVFR